jgi:N-acetylglucosamine-6-phosphate deacetylase
MVTLFSNVQIYTESGLIKGSLVVKDKVIDAIHENDIPLPSFSDATVLTFPETYHVVPGFIDLHVHGANGSDVMDGTEEAFANISATLAKEGTTSFLATTMTAGADETAAVLMALRDYIENNHTAGARMLGIHLEGPFLSSKKVGAQPLDKILNPQMDLIEDWHELTNELIRLVTLAPELTDSLELIEFLKANNIVASIGHTNATYAETIAAIDAGCSYATHLFNAMRGIHQREPGAVTAALLSDQVTAELILDGHHLHPAIVQLALKVKTMKNLVLVTDSMRAKCLKNGVYDLGGQAVTVKNSMATLADGTLAGSVLTMNGALRNLIKFTGCSLKEALQMVSENPAKKMGIFDRKGSIALHKDADLVVLDDGLNVVATMREGNIIFQKQSL